MTAALSDILTHAALGNLMQNPSQNLPAKLPVVSVHSKTVRGDVCYLNLKCEVICYAMIDNKYSMLPFM